jgi:iron complex outermembrane receptor protein
VEILRDGASAQYGSDAIAGVMNIILKDDADPGSFTFRTGITSKGDGELFGISFNNGSKVTEKGFINYTIDMSKVELANRPGKVDASGEIADFGANPDGSPATASSKFLANGGLGFDSGTELYYNAAYVYKKVNSFANYRTPYWRPTDYGLLTPAGQKYMGYHPTFDGNLNDHNATVGLTSTAGGWNSDISFTTGGNKQVWTVVNSINRSLGKSSPTTFRPGDIVSLIM